MDSARIASGLSAGRMRVVQTGSGPPMVKNSAVASIRSRMIQRVVLIGNPFCPEFGVQCSEVFPEAEQEIIFLFLK